MEWSRYKFGMFKLGLGPIPDMELKLFKVTGIGIDTFQMTGIGIETFLITGIGIETFLITGIGIAQSELDPTLMPMGSDSSHYVL